MLADERCESERRETAARVRAGAAVPGEGAAARGAGGARAARHARRRATIAIPLLALPLLLGASADAGEHRAALFGLEGGPCLVRVLAGEPGCPGCGLSRGTALAVQGELRRSWALHPAGPLVALLCALGLGLHLHALAARRWTRRHEHGFRAGAALLVAAVLATWLVRLAPLLPHVGP